MHLGHESLEQRQMLDGSGATQLTDAQYQARLAVLDADRASALSGAATARAAADEAWTNAQSDSKAFYAAWETAAYLGGELRSDYVSADAPVVPGMLPTVNAADSKQAADIAKAKGIFDDSERSILGTEQSTVGQASSASTLATGESDAE